MGPQQARPPVSSCIAICAVDPHPNHRPAAGRPSMFNTPSASRRGEALPDPCGDCTDRAEACAPPGPDTSRTRTGPSATCSSD
jgi:hypothetical protein